MGKWHIGKGSRGISPRLFHCQTRPEPTDGLARSGQHREGHLTTWHTLGKADIGVNEQSTVPSERQGLPVLSGGEKAVDFGLDAERV